MAASAPLRVPVELRLAGTNSRWMRLASAVSEEGLLFGRPLPDELDGPLELRFHLPEDPVALQLDARPIPTAGHAGSDRGEPGDDGRPRPRAVRFVGPQAAAIARIQRYVEARLSEP